jgi:hypothetical protein
LPKLMAFHRFQARPFLREAGSVALKRDSDWSLWPARPVRTAIVHAASCSVATQDLPLMYSLPVVVGLVSILEYKQKGFVFPWHASRPKKSESSIIAPGFH